MAAPFQPTGPGTGTPHTMGSINGEPTATGFMNGRGGEVSGVFRTVSPNLFDSDEPTTPIAPQRVTDQTAAAAPREAPSLGSWLPKGIGLPSLPKGMPSLPKGMPSMPKGMPSMPKGMPWSRPSPQRDVAARASACGLQDEWEDVEHTWELQTLNEQLAQAKDAAMKSVGLEKAAIAKGAHPVKQNVRTAQKEFDQCNVECLTAEIAVFEAEHALEQCQIDKDNATPTCTSTLTERIELAKQNVDRCQAHYETIFVHLKTLIEKKNQAMAAFKEGPANEEGKAAYLTEMKIQEVEEMMRAQELSAKKQALLKAWPELDIFLEECTSVFSAYDKALHAKTQQRSALLRQLIDEGVEPYKCLQAALANNLTAEDYALHKTLTELRDKVVRAIKQLPSEYGTLTRDSTADAKSAELETILVAIQQLQREKSRNCTTPADQRESALQELQGQLQTYKQNWDSQFLSLSTIIEQNSEKRLLLREHYAELNNNLDALAKAYEQYSAASTSHRTASVISDIANLENQKDILNTELAQLTAAKASKKSKEREADLKECISRQEALIKEMTLERQALHPEVVAKQERKDKAQALADTAALRLQRKDKAQALADTAALRLQEMQRKVGKVQETLTNHPRLKPSTPSVNP